MTREALIFSSVAARLEAGTYRPRTARQPSHVPPSLVRRARLARAVEYAAEILVSGFFGGLIGFLLGGGLS